MDEAWLKLVSFYVDSNIKNIDRDIYSFIQALIKSSGFSLVEPDQFETTKSILSVKVVPQSKDKRVIKFDTDITIELAEKNMSLFSASQDLSRNILFYEERDFSENLSLVKYLALNKISNKKIELFDRGLDYLKKNSTPKKIKENSLSKSQIKLIDQIETDIYNQLDFSGINEVLMQYKGKVGKHYKIIEASDVFLDPDIKYFTFGDESKFKAFTFESEEASLFDMFIFNIITESSRRFKIKEMGRAMLSELEDIFSKLNIPIAVFDKDQHLILHNAYFINLNISAKKAFSLKVNDQVTISNEVYKVQKVFIDDGKFVHINFIPVRDVLGKSASPSSEELGIVSSSIAHELNNPLGGILAALNVLELDQAPEQIEKKYEQMREGVLRCKKLIETFLGFTRIKADQTSSSVQLKECFNQAMDLVRFRLIESNVTFNSDYFVEDEYSAQANPYVLSMLFYLFFGEILTNFSHQKLVTQKQSPKINLTFFEKKSSFGIELFDDLKVTDNFIQSKLIKHLLGTQNLHMAHEGQKFTFY